MDSRELIHRYFLGEASAAEATQLDRLLAVDPALRRAYVLAAAMDNGLREVAFERASEHAQITIKPTIAKSPTSVSKWIAVTTIACLSGVALLLAFSRSLSESKTIATLTSGENAAWESSLPTTPGSKLSAGSLKLLTGIATIQFNSGAEVMIEAPANLTLISPMRGKLVAGAAVIHVPEPAIGFVLETPDGYVVDHGTQFAVNVAGDGKPSDFEVIEGEISVHLSSTGEEVRLKEQQSASISEQTLTSFDSLLPERTLEESPEVIRIGTNGRATSVIRNNKRKKRYRPELLMVKQGQSPKWDQRSMCAFNIADIDFGSVESARLRLNLVPSGIGFASRLPVINRFAVYGLVNDAKREWIIESLWEDAPGPEDGELLGTFEVARSVQRGGFGIENDTLLHFLKSHNTTPVTLILVRETGQIKGQGPGLLHAFASDSHPEAAGPILEFSLTK